MTSQRAVPGVDEGVHDPWLYDLINEFEHDVPLWRELALSAAGPVLELCCGSGRITIPLAMAGVDITGLDIEPKMLLRLEERAAAMGVTIEATLEDMRRFELDRKFELIFVPFNSFQHLYSLDDAQRCLARVAEHLAPGGRFVVDVFNPSIELMVDRSRSDFRQRDVHFPDVGVTQWYERCRYDSARQLNRVEWTFIYPDATRKVLQFEMRCYYPLELRLLLNSAGFEVVSAWGDYDRSDFDSDSPKQILTCRSR